MVSNIRPKLYSNSIHSNILVIMTRSKRPMTVDEITNEIIKNNKTMGKTPEKTISSILQRSSFVKRVNKGIYKIRK